MRTRYVLSAVAVVAALGVSATSAWAASSPSPSSSASTVTNPVSRQLLTSAAKTESAAFLQYNAYADAAVKSGRPGVADVWRTVAQVEHQDHWTNQTKQAGLYSGSDNIVNLKTAITQAKQAAKADRSWAAKAPKGSAAATELRTVAARESANATLLTRALAAEQGKRSVPSAPAVHSVSIQVSTAPHYSGTFYNDLTSGSDSALEVAAWNWAEYQFMAKTAVDTGHADLATLFSGLEAQEQYENWAGLSNTAGYVTSDAANLKESMVSEQGAVQMYAQYAAKAQKSGDTTTTNLFHNVGGDEQGHYNTFSTELQELGSEK